MATPDLTLVTQKPRTAHRRSVGNAKSDERPLGTDWRHRSLHREGLRWPEERPTSSASDLLDTPQDQGPLACSTQHAQLCSPSLPVVSAHQHIVSLMRRAGNVAAKTGAARAHQRGRVDDRTRFRCLVNTGTAGQRPGLARPVLPTDGVDVHFGRPHARPVGAIWCQPRSRAGPIELCAEVPQAQLDPPIRPSRPRVATMVPPAPHLRSAWVENPRATPPRQRRADESLLPK